VIDVRAVPIDSLRAQASTVARGCEHTQCARVSHYVLPQFARSISWARKHESVTGHEIQAVARSRGAHIVQRVITLRPFVAIAAKAAAAHYPGRYRGTLPPWWHFLTPEPNGNAAGQAVLSLKSSSCWLALVDRAQADAVERGGHCPRDVIRGMDRTLEMANAGWMCLCGLAPASGLLYTSPPEIEP
jgi:hypothetical protein